MEHKVLANGRKLRVTLTEPPMPAKLKKLFNMEMKNDDQQRRSFETELTVESGRIGYVDKVAEKDYPNIKVIYIKKKKKKPEKKCLSSSSQ